MLLSTYLFAVLDQLRIVLFVTRRSFMLWVNNANTGCADYFFFTKYLGYYLLTKLPVKYQLELCSWFITRERKGELWVPRSRLAKKVRRSLKNSSLTQHDYIFHWVRGRWPLYRETTLRYDLDGLLNQLASAVVTSFAEEVRCNSRAGRHGRGLSYSSVILLCSPFLHVQFFFRKTRPFHFSSTPQFGASFLYSTLRKYVFSGVSYICDLLAKTCSFGFSYLQGFLFLLLTDACLTDDEPLWEPVEWSLVQSWILFIFCFAWIAENLIVSRYGSYTGRDKRVWMAWYKTFWLIEGYYAVTYGIVCLFIIVPFYFELNYSVSFVYSWWHWYSRVFFFKFISLYSCVLILANTLQVGSRWLNWKKGLLLVLLVNIFIAYLIYTHFIMAFFGYFTDPIWYQKYRSVDYIQLSHEPSRWGWGAAKKDHFSYHNVKTVFWFKNDGPFASSFLMFHLFLFLCIFLLFVFWLSLLRRVWATREIPTTLTTYCVSALRQFFYFFLMLYIFVFVSFVVNYMRLPFEFSYFLSYQSWLQNLFSVAGEYPSFVLSFFTH